MHSPIELRGYVMANDNVSKSKLIVGMLSSTDIASDILAAIKLQDDIAKCEVEYKICVDDINTMLPDVQKLTLKCTQNGYQILQSALSELRTYMPQSLAIHKQQLAYSRAGWNMAAVFVGQKMKQYTQRTLQDMNASLLYDLPESIVREKAKEWYLSAFRPANPSEGLVIEQFVRGHMTATQAANFLAIKGVPSDFMQWLYDSYEKYPSIRELAAASQFINIPDAMMEEYFKYSGITLASNKAFYLNYMHAVQIRSEMNNYLGQLKADYNAGLLSEEDLASEIAAHKPNSQEQTQIIENCNHQRTRTLLNMEIQSRTWLYRKGVFGVPASDGEAETAFYYALIEVGLEDVFANGIARFEACKLGYNWERE